MESKASMVKSTVVKLIAQHLVDEQIGGEDFQNLIDSGVQARFVNLKELETTSKELEIKKNEVDNKNKELEIKKNEVENKNKELDLKSRELELRSLESESDLDLQREKLAIERDKISRDKQERAYFDPSRVCKLVPPFKEQDIDQYFTHFEKVASNLERPKESWTSLLQTAFTGKARQAYNDLLDEKSKDYETVKQPVLKVYELIPEAHRLKFRARKMSEGETHVEFVRNKKR